jgi:hypothetical protein
VNRFERKNGSPYWMFLFKPCAIKFWNKLLSSKLINLSFYMQGASARDLEMNIGSYCKFDSCQLYSWGKKNQLIAYYDNYNCSATYLQFTLFLIFVFYLFVCHEQESSTALVNWNCYGQEQQTKEMNVTSQNSLDKFGLLCLAWIYHSTCLSSSLCPWKN